MKKGNIVLKKPLSSLIADRLKVSIWNRDIQFGERLIESEQAKRYEVSRSTIREAFKMLELEGLVVNRVRKGTYVIRFSEEDLEEIIELRTLIETSAFIKALPNIKESHFQTLGNIIKQMREKMEEKNWNDLFDLDMQFHSYVVNLCGNSRIIKIYNSNHVQTRTYLTFLDQYYSDYRSFYNEHKDLLDALLSKDICTVKTAIKRHIEYVEDKLLGVNSNKNTKAI